jgi:hypothetical protein
MISSNVPGGQMIDFAIESNASAPWIWVNTRKNDTVSKIAARRHHPELRQAIADANGIRSVYSKLHRKRIKVPGTMRAADGFSVLAGDTPPRVVSGYAKFETLDRPMRAGLNEFHGYDPITLEVPIRFDAYRGSRGTPEGADIEVDIAKLARMAGRGIDSVSSVGEPPIIRVSVTNAKGDDFVPLIPKNYQRGPRNPTGPLWRVADLDWDEGALRNPAGNRIRQLCVVTLRQHINPQLIVRSAAQRARKKPKPKKKK